MLGVAALVLIAGVDTTWSAIGSSLWHLATHPEDAGGWPPTPRPCPWPSRSCCGPTRR